MSSPKAAVAKRSARDAKRTASRKTDSAKKGAGAANGSGAAAAAAALCREVEDALAEGRADVLAPEVVQNVMSAACRLYSAQIEAGGKELPLGERSPVTATDVMRTASGMLRAADLQVFELGMWVSYTGR
jgi:hypothetical protein